MAEEIHVIIADDVEETRQNIRTLLSFEPQIEVVGEAANGKEAVALSRRLRPDLVLMDINMPVSDGIEATEVLYREMPGVSVIIMSVQGEQEYLRKAMTAGARDYLVKPFGADDLVSAIVRVVEADRRRLKQSPTSVDEIAKISEGRIIVVYSTKGGVGKTVISANLAVALRKTTGARVCLVDLDLQFGDVAVMLDLSPAKTWSDLAREDSIDTDLILSCISHHSSGLDVLAAPLRPEQAEAVTGDRVEAVLRFLRQSYDFVLIDTSQWFHDTTLAALDSSDTIVLIATLDLPTIKNLKLGMEVMESLHYSRDKIKVLLNRSSQEIGIRIEDLEESIGRKVDFHIPSDGKTVVPSVNSGVPFVISDPGTRISESIMAVAQQLAAGTGGDPASVGPPDAREGRRRGGVLSWLFGRKRR